MPLEKRKNGTYRVIAAWRNMPQFRITVGHRKADAEALLGTLRSLHTFRRRDLMEAIKAGEVTLAHVHRLVQNDPTRLATLELTELRGRSEGQGASRDAGAPDTHVYGTPIGELVDEWVAWCASDEGETRRGDPYDDATIRRYRMSWQKLFAWMGNGDVDVGRLEGVRVLADPNVIKDYRRDRRADGRKRSTVNRDMDALRTFWRWVLEAHPELELPDVDFRKTSERERGGSRDDAPRFLSFEELAKLQSRCAPEWWQLFALLLETGLRISEAQHLVWGDVDLVKSTVTVRGSHLKTDSSRRTVPLPPDSLGVLRSLRASDPAPGARAPIWPETQRNYWAARSAWVRMVEQAGIERARIHDLRHTYGVSLVRAGVASPVIQKLMGHKTARMTMRYLAHADDADAALAVGQLATYLSSAKQGRREAASQ